MENHEILPQTMNEIECLNEIVELDDLDLEMIGGGFECPIHCVVHSFINFGGEDKALPTNTVTLDVPSVKGALKK